MAGQQTTISISCYQLLAKHICYGPLVSYLPKQTFVDGTVNNAGAALICTFFSPEEDSPYYLSLALFSSLLCTQFCATNNGLTPSHLLISFAHSELNSHAKPFNPFLKD